MTTMKAPTPDATTRLRGRSRLQKTLLVILLLWLGVTPVFWYLDVHAGLPTSVATNTMTLVRVGLLISALVLPWTNFAGMRGRSRVQRLDATVLTWLFICLAPRFIWELPWLFFLDEIRAGVEDNALWTYFWASYLSGDARYLNGDPLIVTLECIALFVGVFELYALVMFFRQGRRFTVTQLSFILGGMIVEVTLPLVYFGTEIANGFTSIAGTADLIIKFALLNAFWCTLPLITFSWAVRRIARQDLSVTF